MACCFCLPAEGRTYSCLAKWENKDKEEKQNNMQLFEMFEVFVVKLYGLF